MMGHKALYTDDFFYIITIYISKLAACQFLIILARPGEPTLRRTAVKGTLGLVTVWLVIAVVCIAFQCEVPTPWNEVSGQCFNQVRTRSPRDRRFKKWQLNGSSWPFGPSMA